jgi:hypothetical protein
MNSNINNDNIERSQYLKDWYQNNKEKYLSHLKEKIFCNICEIEITRSSIYRHNSSKKHNNNIKTYEKYKKTIEEQSINN